MSSILCRGFLKIIPDFHQTKMIGTVCINNRSIFLQSCLYRAKKSTRERKLKLNRKRKAQKTTANLSRNPSLQYFHRKQKSKNELVKVDDSAREVCADNVWFVNMFKLRQYSFIEAANTCREIHHPTIYNDPSAFLHAYVELDMSTDKKTKFFENFTDVVSVKYPYKHGEDRSILAFCKTRDQIDSALEAGATLAGGLDIITAVKRGKIVLPDFQFVIAHPAIMHDLVVIRGLLRRKFPSLGGGTLGSDLSSLIEKFKVGIRYESKQDDLDPRYGWVDVILGRLDTEVEHLEDNLRLVLANIKTKGPRRTKNNEDYKFMKRCFINTDLVTDRLLISVDDYLGEEEIFDSDDEDEVLAR